MRLCVHLSCSCVTLVNLNTRINHPSSLLLRHRHSVQMHMFAFPLAVVWPVPASPTSAHSCLIAQTHVNTFTFIVLYLFVSLAGVLSLPFSCSQSLLHSIILQHFLYFLFTSAISTSRFYFDDISVFRFYSLYLILSVTVCCIFMVPFCCFLSVNLFCLLLCSLVPRVITCL